MIQEPAYGFVEAWPKYPRDISQEKRYVKPQVYEIKLKNN